MNDRVTQENRKALPKFFITLLLFALLGGVGGFAASIAGFSGLADWAAAGIKNLLHNITPWAIPVCGVILLGIGLGLYRSARGRFNRWDGENEDESEAIESALSYTLLVTTLNMLVSFFFLAASPLAPSPLLLLIFFLISVSFSYILQQKVVDLTRRMNPEKQGSVYDTKFQKKWTESCDEAELAQMGQAAYRALRVTSSVCLLLWVVLTTLNFSFHIGLLPILTVLIIFGVLQITYCLTCIKLSRSK